MKIVVLASEKGGSGKTRLSDELYYYFQRGRVPVSLYSFDGQYSNRTDGKKAEDPLVAVVDTPGSVMDGKTVKTVREADLVIIPVRPTAGNIESFTRTVSLVKGNAKAPILIAVNCSNRFGSAREFRSWLEGYMGREGLPNVVFIPNAEAMAKAEAQRCSVFDISKRSNVAKAINEFGDRVAGLLGMDKEAGQL